MFKFMNLLFQVSSKGDALCDVEQPLYTHWNAVRRNPLTFLCGFIHYFPTCQMASNTSTVVYT